jgi:cell division inhibitor SepF
MTNLLPLPGISKYTIAVLNPQTFDETAQAVDALKAGTVILLNFANLGAETAQRLADFAAGSTCAISGHQKQLGNNIYLFTPPTVEIITQLKAR